MFNFESNYSRILLFVGITTLNLLYLNSKKEESPKLESAYISLIGNTPLIELKKLSKILNRHIFVKMESMNPGGTGKDRGKFI